MAKPETGQSGKGASCAAAQPLRPYPLPQQRGHPQLVGLPVHRCAAAAVRAPSCGSQTPPHCQTRPSPMLADLEPLPPMSTTAVIRGGVLHSVRATIGDSQAALWRRDLPSVAHLCLGIATPNRKIAEYGKHLSHLETSSAWVGRLHAVQKPQPTVRFPSLRHSQGLNLSVRLFPCVLTLPAAPRASTIFGA